VATASHHAALFTHATVHPASFLHPQLVALLATASQKLLDDLEDTVDTGNAALKRETERTRLVTEDSKTCWLYVVICLLIVVLVALVCNAFL
jgi:hypothetical protein